MGYLIDLDAPGATLAFARPAEPAVAVEPPPASDSGASLPLFPSVPAGKSIEELTPLVPAAVARAVWSEASVFVGSELPEEWVGKLVEKAETLFARRQNFRRLLQQSSNAGRDWMWAFMRHWLSALLLKHRPGLHAKLPSSYQVGLSLG